MLLLLISPLPRCAKGQADCVAPTFLSIPKERVCYFTGVGVGSRGARSARTLLLSQSFCFTLQHVCSLILVMLGLVGSVNEGNIWRWESPATSHRTPSVFPREQDLKWPSVDDGG